MRSLLKHTQTYQSYHSIPLHVQCLEPLAYEVALFNISEGQSEVSLCISYKSLVELSKTYNVARNYLPATVCVNE